jgi:hypothetical protein
MHVEFLVEDSSGARLIETLLRKILASGNTFTHRIHEYRGIGRLPKDLSRRSDAKNRQLLDNLPKLLRGYAKNPSVDAVVILLDADDRDCRDFLRQLLTLVPGGSENRVLFRLAIEEVEAWYFGDRQAILKTYPKAKIPVLNSYVQDQPCGTWETLAEAIFDGGLKKLKKQGWPASGTLKHEWAIRIGPHLNIDENQSPSFQKFVSGIRRLTEAAAS